MSLLKNYQKVQDRLNDINAYFKQIERALREEAPDIEFQTHFPQHDVTIGWGREVGKHFRLNLRDKDQPMKPLLEYGSNVRVYIYENELVSFFLDRFDRYLEEEYLGEEV